MRVMHDRPADGFHSDPTVPSRPDLDATVASGVSSPGSSPGSSGRAGLPESIGRYRILGLLGEGGMGSVYKAEQDSPRRTVALKVIKAGVASGRLLHRFEIEAQILGRLDHPGIATIYEAGTFGGGRGARPFFAMEFIEGQELLDYADQRGLGTRDRLGLLARIAEAVQHAHQKGVIHRDLKPGNILVTREGQIKVLDFGVARATDADIQTATMQTDIGQLVGTIPYMSPEQASGNPDDLDTRSDVYALGVIAYELLTGQMPYDLRQKMIHEAVRVIREDEPKTLSTINRTFRGDIEIIVGKALMKEKSLRYQSAGDLAGDIGRYLSDEPIEARAPSTWYQLGKFSRRNRALVAGVAAVLVVSVAGTLISVNFALGEAEQKRIAMAATKAEAEQRGAAVARALEAEEARVRAEGAEAEAEQRAAELEQVAEFQASQLSGIDAGAMGAGLRRALLGAVPEDRRPDAERSVAGVNFTDLALGTLEENIFDRSIAAVDAQFGDQPLVRARLLQTIGITMTELGLLDLAADPLARAIEIRSGVLGGDRAEIFESMFDMGTLLIEQERPDEAEQYTTRALRGFRRVLGDEDPETLACLHQYGLILLMQEKWDEAEVLLLETLEAQRRVLGGDHEETLLTLTSIGGLLRSVGRLEDAEPYYREALGGFEIVLGKDHPLTLTTAGSLGLLLQLQGRTEEAERSLRAVYLERRRVLGDMHHETFNSLINYGNILRDQGKYGEAEPYLREAVESSRLISGEDHPSTLLSVFMLGSLLQQRGDLDGAEHFTLRALEGQRRVLGNDHSHTLASINNMGWVLRQQGRLGEAEPYMLESIAGSRKKLGDEHPQTLVAIGTMGLIQQDLGKFDEAELHLREALGGFRNMLGDEHPHTQTCFVFLCNLLEQQERWAESEEYRAMLVGFARNAPSFDEADLASKLIRLGMNLISQDRPVDAEPVLKECLDIRRRVLPEGDWLVWVTQSLLGEALAVQGRFVDAEGMLVEAAERIDPPEGALVRRREAIRRVVDLYTAWHAAEPGGGYDLKAEGWRDRLTAAD